VEVNRAVEENTHLDERRSDVVLVNENDVVNAVYRDRE
jgi:hypothetical protein